MLKEFKEFAMRGNVIDLAVGVVIGGAFGKIVASLVADVIMPPIGLLVGGVNFTDLKLRLHIGEIGKVRSQLRIVGLQSLLHVFHTVENKMPYGHVRCVSNALVDLCIDKSERIQQLVHQRHVFVDVVIVIKFSTLRIHD